MKTTITAKNMVVTPGITNRITKKTATMSRYLKADTEMFVRLRKERDERICEITVPMNGITLRAESSSKDNLFMAIDSALAKLERQILRHRTKLEKRLREDAYKEETPEFIEDISAYGTGERAIVRTKQFPVRPMAMQERFHVPASFFIIFLCGFAARPENDRGRSHSDFSSGRQTRPCGLHMKGLRPLHASPGIGYLGGCTDGKKDH